ncbi:MAG: DnaB-like helicase C-terminal domain-containing protein [Candidatus Methanomethylophilaceae archaeon]|nr:DnaB-like helicase C-terminal domain-containing protein [Candidatus Methanomethylophilaceae archaeon]
MTVIDDSTRIRKIISNAKLTDHPEEARPIIEIEVQKVARECMAKMEPVAVRDYCRHLNKHLDEYFTRDQLDVLISEVWEEYEQKIRPMKTRPSSHLDDLEKEVLSWGDSYAFNFGISLLDGAWGGLMPGELGVLVGAQGSMKTSLAIKGIINFLQNNPHGSALVFSLDMTPQEFASRFLLRDLGIGINEMYGMIKEKRPEYYEAKARLDEWENSRLKILGNRYRNRWTIDGLEKQVAMKLPSLLVVDFLTCLKKQGQSDLEAVEDIMPRLQSITQKLGTKTLLLSQMGRASKSDQLKGAIGGHSKGGGIVEELAHAEIELFKDKAEQNQQPKIIATVTKTRRGINGASFALDYRGVSMEFTGLAQRVQREKDRKPLFSIVNALN